MTVIKNIDVEKKIVIKILKDGMAEIETRNICIIVTMINMISNKICHLPSCILDRGIALLMPAYLLGQK